jgi:hypothetical protein
MASKKASNEGYQAYFLDKAQAMGFTHRLSEKKFDEEIAPRVHAYRGGKGFLYKVSELIAVVESMVEIAPKY